ncbi:G-type lectin S-receptor-like serine/threonine-protein kinase LECRK2 [Bidens hawaiensis]|uniref:G-type lectin S-receptor-like serine/threonine-protein kinase LECRK2 n=1 Tax=Bidens hawaiensis TaxID=980011 RepID=UPI00404A5216
MALIPIHLISLAILLHFVAAQQNNGFVAVQQNNGFVSIGASLAATPDAKPWLSSSGEFAFGFQQFQGKDSFLLSVWYEKIPNKTIIWYPKGGPIVSTGSKVDLVDRRGLVLSDPQGNEVWSFGNFSDFAYGYMNDTGNFAIVGSNSLNVWESFKDPVDTILPTQVIDIGVEINSKLSKTNFSDGRFQLRLIPDGNLVLNTRDLFTDTPDNAYYVSGTRDADNSSNSGFQLIFDVGGYMYVLRRNGKRVNLTEDSLPSGDFYHRATLDSDGVFTQYSHPKNPTEGTSWRVSWFMPEDICTKDSKACGLNSVCNLDNNRPNCECPPGFSLLDPNTTNAGCKPNLTLSCDEGNGGDVFDFIEITNTDWPGSDFVSLNPSGEQTCRTSCLKDCLCAVAIYGDNRCWKKQLPLANGYKDASNNVKAFLKFKKVDSPSGTGGSKSPTGEDKNGTGEDESRSLKFMRSDLIGTSVIGIFAFIGVIYMCFLQSHKKKAGTPLLSSTTVETNLPRFTYQELVKATDGFKDELGKGAFGTVYKGVIGTKIVAVKKLETVVQDGQKEFKTEVNTIARTHHKNLVQLLGYCDDGEKQLLIYEYMSNGTLAFYLFEDKRPSWNHRSSIAVGVAKGLTYLHEDCSNQIIHCDIKPQNILLDDYYNAKIADFGLAKLLMINQSKTNTGIRGTKGYVAPEWFRNTAVTTKVDVYSFGILLLEIISCRKSVVFNDDAEDAAVLTDMAWDCYQEGRLDAFVENDSEALNDLEKLTTFIMVGLWCVQENPLVRPTMKRVIQMLEGGIEVTEPPCPCPFSVTMC